MWRAMTNGRARRPWPWPARGPVARGRGGDRGRGPACRSAPAGMCRGCTEAPIPRVVRQRRSAYRPLGAASPLELRRRATRSSPLPFVTRSRRGRSSTSRSPRRPHGISRQTPREWPGGRRERPKCPGAVIRLGWPPERGGWALSGAPSPRKTNRKVIVREHKRL